MRIKILTIFCLCLLYAGRASRTMGGHRPVQHCAKHHKHLEECGAYLDHRNEYGQELSGDRQDLRAGKEVL